MRYSLRTLLIVMMLGGAGDGLAGRWVVAEGPIGLLFCRATIWIAAAVIASAILAGVAVWRAGRWIGTLWEE
jgi:hypothetical protein